MILIDPIFKAKNKLLGNHMKCEICKNTIQETFLKKIIGTIIKDEKGKKHSICFECQKKLKTKQEILKNV